MISQRSCQSSSQSFIYTINHMQIFVSEMFHSIVTLNFNTGHFVVLAFKPETEPQTTTTEKPTKKPKIKKRDADAPSETRSMINQ